MTVKNQPSRDAATIILSMILIGIGVALRVLPHPANVAPIAALAFVGGLYLPRRYAVIIPLGAMFISDIVIGLYDLRIMMTVYGSFVLTGILGQYLRDKKTFFSITGAVLLASSLFFIMTNAAVWIFGTLYPHTFSGLLQSYTMAIPFFRNSLIGDLGYTALFIGAFESITYALRTDAATRRT